jgi:hypothetical protein
MAGKSDRPILRLVCALVLLAAGATAVTADPVRGRSRDLGIAFELAGGEQWCGATVTVQLTADSDDAYQPEGMPFLQMIGRIRAIINDQCASVARIVLDGQAHGKKVFAAEMTRLTRWRRIIALDPQTMRPLCVPPPADRFECDKRIAAYVTVSRMMQGPTFTDVEITSLLENRTDLQLGWQANGTFGALKITHRSEYDNRYTTNAAFADANLQSVERICVGEGGRAEAVPAADYGSGLAYRSTLCRRTGAATRINILLVASQGDWFYLFSLWGEDPRIDGVKKMAAALAEQMGGKR